MLFCWQCLHLIGWFDAVYGGLRSWAKEPWKEMKNQFKTVYIYGLMHICIKIF